MNDLLSVQFDVHDGDVEVISISSDFYINIQLGGKEIFNYSNSAESADKR